MPQHQSPPVGLLPRPDDHRAHAAAGPERTPYDLPTIAAQCARIAHADLESLDIAAELAWVSDAAAAAAGRGIPIEEILQAVHEAVCAALATPAPATVTGPTTPMRYLARTSTTVRALDLLTSTISSAYVLQLRALTHSSPEETLAAALLAGTASSTQARQCGIETAGEYHVLALTIQSRRDSPRPDPMRSGPLHPDSSRRDSLRRDLPSPYQPPSDHRRPNPARPDSPPQDSSRADSPAPHSSRSAPPANSLAPAVHPRPGRSGALRRMQAELAGRYPGRALAVLSDDGGTLLIPVDGPPAEAVISQLSRVAGVPITAASVTAATAEIPEAAERAHTTLDVVQRLGLPSGIHHFTDLALEYQLTRPGPGREHLGRLLAPLDDHPELLTTLRCHLASDLSRSCTARRLHVHANTVDYRLKRIAQLTGLDLTRADGVWLLRSAFVAHSYARGSRGAA